jgi:hypothetical protein
MGLEKNQNRSTIYVKIKDGKFYRSDDKEHTDAYDDLSGQVVGLGYRDEVFNGDTIKKFQITLLSGGEKYILGFPVESPAYSSFISFAKNLNLSTPINLHAKLDEYESNGKDVKRTKILLSKGEGDNKVFAKGYYTKGGPNVLPAFKKVKISGKDFWDKTEYLDFLYNVVENDLKPQLPNSAGTASVVFKEQPKAAIAESEDLDNLPF